MSDVYHIIDKGLSHLEAAIGTGEQVLRIPVEDYSQFLDGSQGPQLLILRGPAAREFIKLDPRRSIPQQYLWVDRGQQGTSPLDWPKGTKIWASTTAGFYANIVQPGEARTVTDNPNNSSLTPIFPGEEIYQDSPVGCERWWKSYNGRDPYWDLITGAPCLTETYQDVGWLYPILLP